MSDDAAGGDAMSVFARLHGVFAPVVTPCLAGSEDLDVAAFESNIRAHLADGLSGIVVAGSTGEAALLSEDERARLVAAARAVIPADKLLIVGTGAESTRQCVARCRAAKDGGADAVLVVAPHYYSSAMTPDALAAHYARVADESPLPVLLYNIPKYMHFALPAELVRSLAKHANVIGIKDSSGDLEMLKGFLSAQGDAFTVLTGSGSGLHAGLDAGARGGILAVSLFAAPIALDILAAHKAGGQTGRAVAAQAKLAGMNNVIVAKLGVPGIKAALDHMGRKGGAARLPLLPLTASQRAEMLSVL
ncbi:MAG TPA: dihydrodipicolinate synthase family protein [Gemmatimonadaceae bacterium]|nr:dihydrodipicolinate synthase family protein [Gemmatimonadaceae bacterium]